MHRATTAKEVTPAHPDYLILAERIKGEAPFGRLCSIQDGQQRIGDYMQDAYDVEDHGHGPVQWIGRKALAYLQVTGPHFNMQAAGFFGDRSVLIAFNNTVIGTLQFGKEQNIASIAVDEWIGRDVTVTLTCDNIVNPMTEKMNFDNRDLGALISSIYFD
jgi:hypothetical protein